MPKNSPLAEKKEIKYRDLKDLPIIVSRASLPYFSGNENLSSLNIIATYNLIYNASLMVEDGLGYAICFDSLINTTGDSSLCIRPLVATSVIPLRTLATQRQKISSQAKTSNS